MCPHNDNLRARPLTQAKPRPHPPPARQADQLQPEHDEVQVGQLGLPLLHHQGPGHGVSPVLRHQGGAVQLLPQVEHEDGEHPLVTEEHLVSGVQGLVTSVVPDV